MAPKKARTGGRQSMTDQNHSATEETGSTPVVASPTKRSPRSFLDSARRNLSEEELKAPGAIRLLISEIERLDERTAELQLLANAYHDLRVEKAVLDEKLKVSKWHEIMSGLCLATGSAGIGISFRLLALETATGVGALIISVLLVLVGILSKVLK